MFKVIILLQFVLCFSLAEEENITNNNEDVNYDKKLSVPEVVKKNGYPLETHTVQTKDGYLLTIHRIPYGKSKSNETNKPVVFLMHGLLCSSLHWVIMDPGKSLGYILADAGYDVWMGNARGNVYSRKHVNLDPDKDDSFWDFSWHEIGFYDLPEMLDHILNITQEEKLFYIGHSQGTTTYFVMTSMIPKYNDVIRLMIALAPIAYMGNMPSGFCKMISPLHERKQLVANTIGLHEFTLSKKLLKIASDSFCKNQTIVNDNCIKIWFMIVGYDEEQINKTMLPAILSSVPAGASTKQILHYGQEIKSGKFRQYDFGPETNLEKYKNEEPPDYNISSIISPVVLFSAKNDLLASLTDIKALKDELPNVVYYHEVEYEKFNHLDFLWAKDVNTLLYNKILPLLKQY